MTMPDPIPNSTRNPMPILISERKPHGLNKLEAPHASLDDLQNELMKMELLGDPLITKALEQATSTHGFQRRDDGFITLFQHIYPVAIDVMRHYPEKVTPVLIAGALLHDVPEDDKSLAIKDFIERFGDEVYGIVKPLKKPDWKSFPGKTEMEKKFARNIHYVVETLYLSPLKSQIIKLEDRLNNVSCINGPNKEKIRLYTKETEIFYLPFAREVSEYHFNEMSRVLKNIRETGLRF